jgi:hypothetical protein
MTASPSMPSAIVQAPLYDLAALNSVKKLGNLITALRDDVFREGMDFGKIPGTGEKPTLLLPGMEKLMRALNVVPNFIERHVIRDYDRPLFHYEYECQLVDIETGKMIPGGLGIGLCTSMESAFRWRQSERVCPNCGKPAIIKGKAEYGGGWVCFDKKGGCKSKFSDNDPAIIDQKVGRVENPDIFDQVNSIMKRGKKRALADAIKGAANVSEMFTVDLEDFYDIEQPLVVEGRATEVKTTPITVAVKAVEEAPKLVEEAAPAPTFDKNKWDAVSAKAWYDARIGHADFNEPTKDDIFNALHIKVKLSEFKDGGWDAADAALKAYFGTPVDQRYAPVRDADVRLGTKGAKLAANVQVEVPDPVVEGAFTYRPATAEDIIEFIEDNNISDEVVDAMIEDNIQDLAGDPNIKFAENLVQHGNVPTRQWFEPKPDAPVAPAAPPPPFKKDDMKNLLVEGRVHMQQIGKSANSVCYSFKVIGDLGAPDGVPDKRIEFAECMSRKVFDGTKIDTSKWPKDDPKVQSDEGLWLDLGWTKSKVTFVFACEYNGKGGWIIKGVTE